MTAIDMSQFIAAKSDQLNADDLMDNPRTITITKVTAAPDAAEQPVSIHYQGGEGRPFKPCKTMRRIMVAVWGKDASKYVGRSMTLYRDPNVQFGGLQVGGIRVSHMSHIDEKKTVALLVTRGRKAPYTVQPLKGAPSQAPADDAATNWTNAFISNVDSFTELAALETFEAEKSGRLADLKTKRPELHQRIYERLVARKTELAPSGSSPADASATSGTLTEILDKITGATDLGEVDAIDRDTEFDRQFLTETDCDDLDAALAARRSELREGADA